MQNSTASATVAEPKTKRKPQTGRYYRNTNKSPAKNSEKSSTKFPVKIAFLGGLNEVGKNLTVFECNDEMMILDCGLAFPDSDLPGVDIVLPDFSYLEKNADKIKGIVITHGHEDHIGGLAYLLKTVNVPIYATRLTIGLIEYKLREHDLLDKATLNVVKPGDTLNLGEIKVELIHVNHSIPDALGVAIKTKGGTIVHTGDFKIDSTPIDGEVIDLRRFAQLGDEGVLCLMADSTNAERPGYTESERKVGESFANLFRKAGNRRIIVATFASNIHRVQQIIDVAQSLGRKVAVSGRSLENVCAIGQELGYLKIPEGLLVSIEMVNKYPADRMVIITTGSQGEPMSALTRMAFSEHRRVEVGANDYVIISATPIPGNEKTVSNVVNGLMKLGAEVVYEKMYEVHVSGHACQEELKIIMGLTKPKYFIPVHGEQKHLRKNAALAESMGIDRKNILIADNGVLVEITNKKMNASASVPSGKVYVDGYGVGDVGSAVLRDRRHLAQDGIIIVAAVVDTYSGYVATGPQIESKGFVYVKEAEELIEEAKKLVSDTLDTCIYKNSRDLNMMRSKVKEDVSRLMYERTKRSPIILPIILEV